MSQTPDAHQPRAAAGRLRAGIATGQAEREACFRLRYRTYVEEMKLDGLAADHARRMLSDEFDRFATIFYVASGDEIIATARNIRAADAVPTGYESAFDLDTAFAQIPREQISFTGYLAVAPHLRGTVALARLIKAIYHQGRAAGIRFDFVSCDPALVTVYEMMGYRRFKPPVIDPDYGLAIALVLVTDDVEHLSRIRSPFATIAHEYDNDPAHGKWFAEKFARYARPSSARLMGLPDFWRYVADRIDMDSVPLLRGLEAEEARDVMRSGVIVNARKGDALLRAGAVGREMYLLLSGAAEVRSRVGGAGEVVLRTLGRGDTFGEMGLLRGKSRSADVVAISDIELLTLDRAFFERLIKTRPAAAARMLWNLASTLGDWLDASTETLVAGAAHEDVGESPLQ